MPYHVAPHPVSPAYHAEFQLFTSFSYLLKNQRDAGQARKERLDRRATP
jgi:hypothetical protein